MTAFRIFTMVVAGLLVAYLLLSIVGLIAILYGAKSPVPLPTYALYSGLAQNAASLFVAFLAITNAALGLNSQVQPSGSTSNS